MKYISIQLFEIITLEIQDNKTMTLFTLIIILFQLVTIHICNSFSNNKHFDVQLVETFGLVEYEYEDTINDKKRDTVSINKTNSYTSTDPQNHSSINNDPVIVFSALPIPKSTSSIKGLSRPNSIDRNENSIISPAQMVKFFVRFKIFIVLNNLSLSTRYILVSLNF